MDASDTPARLARAARALGPAVVLVGLAIAEIVALAGQDKRVAGDVDWAAATAHVSARHRPGEPIVFAPTWLDPVGRRWLGDRVSPEIAGRADDARFPVLWEVAQGDARAAGEIVDLEPTDVARFGSLTVRRFERAAAVVVHDFVAGFPAAEATGPPSGRAVLSLEEVGFTPRRCVKIVPKPGESAWLTYRGVELGSSLVVHAGLADVFTRRDVRAPGRLHVAIDGDEVAVRELGVDDGWVRIEIPTRPGRATVVFQASAVGRAAKDRRICFAAEARR